MKNTDMNWLTDQQEDSLLSLDESSSFEITPDRTTVQDDTPMVAAPSVDMQTQTIVMGKDKYAAFMNILQFIKQSCQDVYIRNGKISQINTKHSMFFSIDMTPIFGDASLVISNVLGKYDILSIFKKQGVDVCLDITPEGYTFRDSQSKIKFKRPIEQFLESTYCSPSEIQSKIQPDLNKRIFKYTWKKIILDRVLSLAKFLATPVLRIEFEGDKVGFKVRSLDNASTTQVEVLSLEDELDDTSLRGVVAPFPAMCFINYMQGGIIEIESELYHRLDTTRPSVALKLYGSLPIAGTDLVIPIVVESAGYADPNEDENGNII